MAIITLYSKSNSDEWGSHYVDLETEIAGRYFGHVELPPPERHSVLCIDSINPDDELRLDYCSDLPTLTAGRRRVEFELIQFDDANPAGRAGKQSAVDLKYKVRPVSELRALPSGKPIVLRIRDALGDYRYFKVLVRSGFSESKAALMFEELVEGRIIIPVNLLLNREATRDDGKLDITNPEDPEFLHRSTLNDYHWEILWTICDDPDEGPGDDGYSQRLPTERFFYDTLYPISKAVFYRPTPDTEESGHEKARREKEFLRQPPSFVADFQQRTIASESYLNSTLLMRVDQEVRAAMTKGKSEHYTYEIVVLDGVGLKTVIWDPEVVIDPP